MTGGIRQDYMKIALGEAKKAAARGEVPVGAVLVNDRGEVLAQAGNETRALSDPSAHAEILAIRRACADLATDRLNDCDLYVTLEPCPMCAAAISFARIRRLYFAASDPKSGGVLQGARVFSHATCHHAPEIYDGIEEDAARKLLQDFFASRRG